MIKIPEKNNQDSTGALVNEEKGNLFEFLVAQILSRISGVEDKFFHDLNPDLKNNMAGYEESLRKSHPELISLLAKMANQTSTAIDNFLKNNNILINNIFLVGKIAANFEKEEWHEADLIIQTNLNTLIPISLKLSKDNSFMNTKSAGAKSFIEKYFLSFDESEHLQLELNKEIDQAHMQMAHRLYQLASLEFTGKFDQVWSEKWSELPGELPDEYRKIVFINYARVAELIHKQLITLLKLDRDKFTSSLPPLCGMGDNQIIQVSCFHQQHIFKSVEIKEYINFFYPQVKVKILPLKDNVSSFDILIGDTILQIRVKPMNKFTTPSYKINCSIRRHKD